MRLTSLQKARFVVEDTSGRQTMTAAVKLPQPRTEPADTVSDGEFVPGPEEELQTWLASIGCEAQVTVLLEHGFTHPRHLYGISLDDLIEMHIAQFRDRMVIFRKASALAPMPLRPQATNDIHRWLDSIDCINCHNAFEAAGILSVLHLQGVTDHDLQELVGIAGLGYRKRVLHALL